MEKEDMAYTTGQYPAIEKIRFCLPFPIAWIELEHIMLYETSQVEKSKFYLFSFM